MLDLSNLCFVDHIIFVKCALTGCCNTSSEQMPELDTYDLGSLLECMNFIRTIQEFHRKNVGNMKKNSPIQRSLSDVWNCWIMECANC